MLLSNRIKSRLGPALRETQHLIFDRELGFFTSTQPTYFAAEEWN